MAENVLFPCRSCRAELRAPKSRIGTMVICGGCRERVLVPDSSAIARLRELAAIGNQTSRGLLHFYFSSVLINWSSPAPEIRSCEACGELSIECLSTCRCGRGLRVSTSLRELKLPSMEASAQALQELPLWKARQTQIQVAVVALIALGVLWLYASRNLLAVLIFGPVLAISLLILGLSVLVGIKLYLNWRLLPRLPLGSERRAIEALESLEAELLRPFLARQDIYYRTSLPEQLEDEDSRLLQQLLATKGWELELQGLRRWLYVTAFRMEMERIADQLHFLKQEQGCGDTLSAWQIWSHACGPESLCVLRWFLLQEGEDQSEAALKEQLEELQSKAALEAFERDLKKRQAGPPQLTITALDTMDPYSFEEVLAVLYRAMGYKAETTRRRRVEGCRGADIILELAGERRAVQAKRYSTPVGPAAVREVLTSLKVLNCQMGMVVTNSTFSDQAQEFAKANGVKLIDREGLEELIAKFNSGPHDGASLSLLLRPRAQSPEAILAVGDAEAISQKA